jgi:hypothetical protein
MPLRRLLALSLVLLLFAALPPVAAAQGPDFYAQASQPPEPEPGEPQPGTPPEPENGAPPEAPGEAPTTDGGLLPRTGLGAGWIALIGIALLLLGIRLRVITRIKEVVRRYVTPRTRLRESLEELRAAGVAEERRRAELGPQVEPSTPTARRMADVH